jgi:hypothetical protein
VFFSKSPPIIFLESFYFTSASYYFFLDNDKKLNLFYLLTKQNLNLPLASSLQFLLLSAVLEFGLEEDLAELILAPPADKTEEEFSRCF